MQCMELSKRYLRGGKEITTQSKISLTLKRIYKNLLQKHREAYL